MIWINRFFLFMSLSGSIALLLYYLVKALFANICQQAPDICF